MSKIKNIPKVNIIIILIVLGLVVSISIPTLARFKNRNTIETVNVWDGLVATSFRKGNGTKENPYIIANGNELAYFKEQLKNNDFKDKYVKLNNDIIINNGIFDHNLEGVTYTLNNKKYYLKKDSNEYYGDLTFLGKKIGNINLFESLNNFKGHFDGDNFTIYGLYLKGETATLFDNLEGSVDNLYLDNSLLLGNSKASIINANNSNITNILFNGKIISSKELEKTITNNLPDLNTINGINKLDIDISNMVSLTLTGHSSNNITINGTNVINDFNITLKDNNLNITGESLLSNLTYTLTYKEGLSSLINGNNLKLDTIINKGTIKSKLNAGLIGIGKDISLTNSYNTGSIESKHSGGLASILSGNSSISYSYNNGNVTNIIVIGSNPTKADIVNTVNDNLTINNVFNTKNNFLITNNNGKLNITNLLYVNKGIKNSNEGTKVTLSNLKDKNYLVNLGFKEYDGKINNWVYHDEYPISYIDDINNKVASINIGNYHYEDLGYVLNDLKFNSNTAFKITDIGNNKATEKYYYISDKVLNKDEIENLSWTKYNNIVELNNEGYYVIYAKIIDNNKIHYLNTDRIVLDKTKASVTIKANTKEFTTLNENPNNTYFDDSYKITINATDNLSGIKSIKYYISDKLLTTEELKNSGFIDYVNDITITDKTKKIIYAKVLDNMDFETIVNTDYLSIDGFSLTVDNLNINNKSNVNLTYKSNNSTTLGNLVFNQNIPINTKIILNNKYIYKVDKEINNIPLNKFKEIGKGTMDNYFNENLNNYNFSIQFNTDKVINNLIITLENNEIKTLKKEIKPININDSKYKLHLESNFKNTIDYNSDSVNNINFNLSLIKSNYIDTTYDDKLLGLAIKLVDTDINTEYLKTIKFKYNDKLYFPSSDGIVRINLNTINDVNGVLSIIVDKADIRLNGNYKFIISGYTAYDGMYGKEFSNELEIPLTSNYVSDVDYKFDVKMPSMIKKTDKTLNISCDYTNFNNSNIRVSLYRKEYSTAYNQNYILVDLNNYISGLELIKDNVYYLTKEKLNDFNLNISNFTGDGYELVFELYDDNKKIGTVSKKFIVR